MTVFLALLGSAHIKAARKTLVKLTPDLEKCSHLEDKTDDVMDLTFAGLGQLDGDDKESATSRQNLWTANLKTEKRVHL